MPSKRPSASPLPTALPVPRPTWAQRLAQIAAHPFEAFEPYPGPPHPWAVFLASLVLGSLAWSWLLPRHSFVGLVLLLGSILMAGLAAGSC